jgi:predicted DNA-binding transcriptional regulator AlpA
MIAAVSPNADSIRIPRLPQVCEVTGLCRSMIYQMEADLWFPNALRSVLARWDGSRRR